MGLGKFENDAFVSAVIGYCHPYPFKTCDNNFFFHRSDFSAWGYGTWTAKQNKIIEEIRGGCLKKTFSCKNYLKVRKHGYNRLLSYLSIVLISPKKYIWITDSVLTVYNIVNDKCVVVPVMSKVRNEGWDLSGCSIVQRNADKFFAKYGQVAARHNEQVIDSDITFEYKGMGHNFFEYNDKVAVQFSDGRISYLSFIGKVIVLVLKFIVKRIIRK